MGLFDWLGKPKRPVTLPQLCYDVAFCILPHYTFKDLGWVADLCQHSLSAAGPYFYILAAQARQVDPDSESARQFHWHAGRLTPSREYFALEYPPPPPADASAAPHEKLLAGRTHVVPSPYFSTIVRGDAEPAYFILGPAPTGGGTTLHRICPDGRNFDLGPGPKPELSAFLDAVRTCLEKKL